MPAAIIRSGSARANHARSQTVCSARPSGAPGLVSLRDGRPFSVGAFHGQDGKIVEIDLLADPERVAQLDLDVLDD